MAAAKTLIAAEEVAQCAHLLMYFSTIELLNGLALVKALNALFEIQVRDGGGPAHLSMPASFDQIW